MTIRAQIRVLYGDTDAMGQAYYGNFFRWFEVGRAEWFRSCCMSYKAVESQGYYLPVVEAHCTYKKPARYDDVLTISTTFRFERAARFRFEYAIHRDEDLVAEGYTVHVCVNSDLKVLRPPDCLKKLMKPGQKDSSPSELDGADE